MAPIPPGHVWPTKWERIAMILWTQVLLGVIDWLWARHTKARWFFLHAVANAFVVLFSLTDCYDAIRDPVNALDGVYSMIPLYAVAGIHMYHLVAFRNLPWSDWFHHITFGGTICSAALFGHYGPVQNLVGFFLSGLPGGILYVMMVMQKHDMVHPLTVKIWNARINVWLRAPGCMAAAFVLWTAVIYNNFSIVKTVICLCAALLTAFNGLYYMQQVVGNTFRKNESFNS